MKPLSPQTLQMEGFIQSPQQLSRQLGKRFDILCKIGEGSFGIVVYARQKQTGKEVAMKKIKMSTRHEGIPATALRQISILRSLNHPNIIKLGQIIYEPELSQLCFILEYHPSSLDDFIKERHPLTFHQIRKYSYQMLSCLRCLHQKGIIHRDLKPQNFLISSSEQLILCDFGQAKYTFFRPQQHTTDISTLWYRAPEILMGSLIYDEKVDTWAAGCIIAQMIIGKPIFFASSQVALLFTIFRLLGTPKIQDCPFLKHMKDLSPKYPKFSGQGINITSIPKVAKDFLERILVVHPGKRMGVKQALRHPFVAGTADKMNKERYS